MHPRHKILKMDLEVKFASKNKGFLWLLLREALPTYDSLITRRLKITNTYYLCNHNSENIIVLLFKEFGTILNIIVLLLSFMKVNFFFFDLN